MQTDVYASFALAAYSAVLIEQCVFKYNVNDIQNYNNIDICKLIYANWYRYMQTDVYASLALAAYSKVLIEQCEFKYNVNDILNYNNIDLW